jgi:ubiquitin C-terminal hydrolase
MVHHSLIVLQVIWSRLRYARRRCDFTSVSSADVSSLAVKPQKVVPLDIYEKINILVKTEGHNGNVLHLKPQE